MKKNETIPHKSIKERACPLCLGIGYVKSTSSSARYSKRVRNKARTMRRNGMTYRAIGEKLNINHPQKVRSLIFSFKQL